MFKAGDRVIIVAGKYVDAIPYDGKIGTIKDLWDRRFYFIEFDDEKYIDTRAYSENIIQHYKQEPDWIL